MAKFCGIIGYVNTVEVEPGIWEEAIVEKKYYGDLVQNFRKLENSGEVNDNINVSNKISIVADPYANQNFHSMRYVEFMGTRWKITNVEVKYPRLILSVGGVYNNGEQATTA